MMFRLLDLFREKVEYRMQSSRVIYEMFHHTDKPYLMISEIENCIKYIYKKWGEDTNKKHFRDYDFTLDKAWLQEYCRAHRFLEIINWEIVAFNTIDNKIPEALNDKYDGDWWMPEYVKEYCEKYPLNQKTKKERM